MKTTIRTGAALGLGVLGTASAALGQTVTNATYVGATGGSWNDPLNWDTAVPNNSPTESFDVFVNGDGFTNVNVLVNMAPVIDNLTVDAGDTIDILNGREIRIDGTTRGGSLVNAGVVNLLSSGSSTYIRHIGDLTISGGGAIALSDISQNWIYSTTDGTLHIQDQTITGAGNIGNNSTRIINEGTVRAFGNNYELRIDPNDSGMRNDGVLEAADGVLRLNAGNFDNALGVIQALDGGVVEFHNGPVVAGGLIQMQGTGTIRTSGGTSYLDGRVSPVTFAGRFDIQNAHRLGLYGVIDNQGVIALGSTGSSTYLYANDGLTTLTGGGEIHMSDEAQNWFFGVNGGSVLNLDNLIHGAGHIGFNQTDFENRAVIRADATTPLEIQPGAMSFINEGAMQADGGNLVIRVGTIQNANGVIEALNGSLVQLWSDAIIEGGFLSTSGAGVISAASGTSMLDGETNPVVIDGSIEIENARRLHLKGDIENRGTISLKSTGSSTYLQPNGVVTTLTGGGRIILSDNAQNWIYGLNDGSLVNVDNTIEGGGHLGFDRTPITNQATIVANTSTPFIIDPDSTTGLTNTGNLRADGGTLRLRNGDLWNDGGLVEADDGSMVELYDAAVIHGGTLRSLGTGLIQAANGSSELDGTVTPVVNEANLRINNARTLRLSGTVENRATIGMDSTGSSTKLILDDAGVTLIGGGEIVLSSNLQNWIYAATSGTLTNEDNTIRGGGHFGWDRTGIINRGVIDADDETIELRLDAGPLGVTNEGTIRASAAGGIDMNPAPFTNRGLLEVEVDSHMTVGDDIVQTAGSTMVNGPLSVTDGFVLQGGTLGGTHTLTTDMTAEGGVVAPGQSVGRFTINGAVNLESASTTHIEIAGTNDFDELVVTGDLGLGGTLAVDLIGGFDPSLGHLYTIMSASGEMTGQFDQVIASDPTDPFLELEVLYDYAAGLVKIVVEYRDGVYTGSPGGSWFDSSNWHGGLVPHANMNVFIPTQVLVDALGAEAANVLVGAGGELVVGGGSAASIDADSFDVLDQAALTIAANGAVSGASMTVRSGGVLALTDPTSSLALHSLHLESGAGLAWDAGTIMIDGGAMTVDDPNLLIGDTASLSTLYLLNGATATVPVNTFIGVDAGDLGSLIVEGAGTSFTTGDTLFVGFDGVGALDLIDAAVNATTVDIGLGGEFSGRGLVNASMVNAGRVVVGRDGVGDLAVAGDFTTTADGVLEVELNASGDHDTLSIGGAASFDGTMNVTTLGGYEPTIGDAFTVATFANAIGEFATINLPALVDPQAKWRVEYLTDSLRLQVVAKPTLTVTAPCPNGGAGQVGWSNATPNGQVAIVFSTQQGSFTIPSGFACAGTELEIGPANLQVAFQGPAGATGSRTLNVNFPRSSCGGFIQLIDAASCNVSNVVQID
ncbi:MAG: beta strand repeat-containing protein [Phycisphaerales bacterium]